MSDPSRPVSVGVFAPCVGVLRDAPGAGEATAALVGRFVPGFDALLVAAAVLEFVTADLPVFVAEALPGGDATCELILARTPPLAALPLSALALVLPLVLALMLVGVLVCLRFNAGALLGVTTAVPPLGLGLVAEVARKAEPIFGVEDADAEGALLGVVLEVEAVLEGEGDDTGAF